MSWKKITLFKYQQIEEINANEKYDELARALFTACVVFDLTEHEMDKKGAKGATKYINKVRKIFSSPVQPSAAKAFAGFRMLYDVSGFTFGQYVELAFFLQAPVKNAHFVLASCSRPPFRSYRTDGHKDRADRFLASNVEKALGAVQVIKDRFDALNKEYPHLFGLDDSSHSQKAKADSFNRRYGWTYSASAIAEYERVPLEQVYAMPVRQAFNDLAYLKEKVKYEIRERDRQMREFKMNQNA